MKSLRNRAIFTLLPHIFVACVIMPAKSQTSFEIQELRTTLEAAAHKIHSLESQLAAAQARNEALIQSAATANQTAQDIQDRHDRLRGLLEGLGIAALEGEQSQIQERLLSALSDLRVSETSRLYLATALMELAEATLEFSRDIVDHSDKSSASQLADCLKNAEQALLSASSQSSATPESSDQMQNARVVSYKSELGLAILSVGHTSGVRSGMPFDIYRDDKPIAKVLVTEVRNSVCGAVVQEFANKADPVRVGDKGKVDINRSF